MREQDCAVLNSQAKAVARVAELGRARGEANAGLGIPSAYQRRQGHGLTSITLVWTAAGTDRFYARSQLSCGLCLRVVGAPNVGAEGIVERDAATLGS